jgi:hypothetical protein
LIFMSNMTESFQPEKNERLDGRMSNAEAARELFLVCQGLQVDKGDGVGNVAANAQLLYDALYHKDIVVEAYEIAPDPRFPATLPLIKRPLTHVPKQVPERVEFIELVRDVTTREIDHESILYAGASDVIREMVSDGGHAVIWTNGDHGDGPDVVPITEHRENYSVSQRPGSYEQLKKIVGGGFAKLRREEALARLATSGELLNPATLRDVLVSFVSRDKFASQIMDDMAVHFTDRGVQDIVVLEDRADNLVRLKEEMTKRGIRVHGIVIRQGKHGLVGDTPEGMDEADSLERARSTIAERYKDGGVSYGFVSDFDGVLSNQGQRRQLQADMVVAALAERRWI